MNIVILITIIAIVLLFLERFIISRRVRSIPIRIHVNGTRGKSSITRYITAILSASQFGTYGKITGVIPTLIHPDGTQTPIRRIGNARIQEQLSIISAAAANSAQALVLECMSLKPEYQRMETQFFCPTISILAAIEDDHREEMGETDAERVAAIAESIPFNSFVITSDSKHFSALEAIASVRKSRLIMAPALTVGQISLLPEGIFPDNAALAVAAAVQIGIEEQMAFSVMTSFSSKSECSEFLINNVPVRFINGFAVNDIPSAERFFRLWKDDHADSETIFIVNTRNDRPLRTVQFARWCSELLQIRHVYITGTHSAFAYRTMIEMNVACSTLTVDRLFSHIKGTIDRPTDIFGFGNIAGDGFIILDQISSMKAAQ